MHMNKKAFWSSCRREAVHSHWCTLLSVVSRWSNYSKTILSGKKTKNSELLYISNSHINNNEVTLVSYCLTFCTGDCNNSSLIATSQIPGGPEIRFAAPSAWNSLQTDLKTSELISLQVFHSTLFNSQREYFELVLYF